LIEAFDPYEIGNQNNINDSASKESKIEESIHDLEKLNLNYFSRNKRLFSLDYHLNKNLKNKNLNEKQLDDIREYLFTEFNFRNISLNYNDELHFFINLEIIIPYLDLEIFSQDKLLANYQEKIPSIYFLLEGNLELLIPKPYKLEITPQDYLLYLAYLKKNKESDLVKLVIERNNYEVIQSNLILESNINKNNLHSFSPQYNQLNLINESLKRENEFRNLYNFCLGQFQQFLGIKKEIKIQYRKFILETLKKYLENKTENGSVENNLNYYKNNDKSEILKETYNIDLVKKNYGSNLSENSLLHNNHFNLSVTNKFHNIDKNESEKKYFNKNNLLKIHCERENDMIKTDNEKENKINLTLEEVEFLENIENIDIFKKENLIFIKRCIFDQFSNYNNSILKISDKDYFFNKINNFYVINEKNLKKKRILNVRIKIKKCECKKEKFIPKNVNCEFKENYKKEEILEELFIKLNFKIDLDRLEDKIFKEKSNSFINNLEKEDFKQKFKASMKNDFIHGCLSNDNEYKFEKQNDLRVICNLTSSELMKKFDFDNPSFSDFFISNYSVENDFKNNNLEFNQKINIKNPVSNNNFQNKYNFDIFNERFSEDEEEDKCIETQNVEKLLCKLKEKYKIIKIPFEIFKYNLLKTIKKGEIIGNFNDKIKCYPAIISKQETFFLKIPKNLLEGKIEELNKSNLFQIFSFFSSSPIFRELNKIQFYKMFFKQLNYNQVRKSDKIINEGDFIKDLIFIHEGNFEIKIKKSILEINEIIKKLTNKKSCENEDNEQEKILGDIKFIIQIFINAHNKITL